MYAPYQAKERCPRIAASYDVRILRERLLEISEENMPVAARQPLCWETARQQARITRICILHARENATHAQCNATRQCVLRLLR